MTVLGEITYVFYMPQDYDEMKLFEAEHDSSIYTRKMDTIAVRYTFKTNATYPYKRAKDSEYYRGRVDGMEYVIDSIENAFKGKESE